MDADDLLTKYPQLKEFFPYLNLLNKESDRGKVLISTGYLEHLLRDTLLAFLIDNSEAKDLVDGHNAPLGTFSARITACYAMGLISEHEHRDLNLLRKIRNDFAHHMHTSFETQSVVNRCKQLRFRVPDDKHVVEAAGQFTSAAVALIVRLVYRSHYVGRHRLKLENWLV